jgi:hypothetical protein
MADPQYVHTQRQADGNTYDIYRAATRREALAFLRRLEVKEERRYAIVETPEGNIGKDFILIFDEGTTVPIELGQRKPLAAPQKAEGHCCKCGYPVIPFAEPPVAASSSGHVTRCVVTSQAKESGAGYACPSCGAICCALCAAPEQSPVCVLCGGSMQPYEE